MNILITGGSKGIGRAIALRFAVPGNTIFINYRSDTQSAQHVVDEVTAHNARAVPVKVDIGTPQGCQQVIDLVAETTDRLDLVVHGAVKSITGPTLSMDPAQFAAATELNASALLYLTQAALPLLTRGSSIVFLTSKGSVAAVPDYAALGAPKAMAEALVRYLAVELAPKGIRINSVSAGPMDTEAFRSMFATGADKRLAAAAAANPSGRGVEVGDVANLVEFLASERASMIQGQRLHIDGGLYLR